MRQLRICRVHLKWSRAQHMRRLQVRRILFQGVPACTLGLPQRRLPAHGRHHWRFSRAGEPGDRPVPNAQHGQVPAQVLLHARVAARVGRVPGARPQARAGQHPHEERAHRDRVRALCPAALRAARHALRAALLPRAVRGPAHRRGRAPARGPLAARGRHRLCRRPPPVRQHGRGHARRDRPPGQAGRVGGSGRLGGGPRVVRRLRPRRLHAAARHWHQRAELPLLSRCAVLDAFWGVRLRRAWDYKSHYILTSTFVFDFALLRPFYSTTLIRLDVPPTRCVTTLFMCRDTTLRAYS